MRSIFLIIFLLLTSLYAEDFKVNSFFEKNGAVMLLIDPKNGDIVKANQSASKFYGHTIQQLERMKIQDINTFTKEQVQAEMLRAKSENRNYFIFRHKLDSGEIKRVEVYSHPITYKGRKVLYSTIHDVTNLELAQQTIEHYSKNLEKQVDSKTTELMRTETTFRYILVIGLIIQLFIIIVLLISIKKRKKAEKKLGNTLEKLTVSERKLREIISSFPISIIRAKKKDHSIDFFNKSFRKLFGWSIQEIDSIDKWYENAYPDVTYRERVKKDWQDIIDETHQHKLKTSKRPLIVHIACKNGSFKECQVWYHHNEENIYGIFYDMTKLKELEIENLTQQKLLLTQSKIAALGEMLGNIAHQWRQPLSSITARISGMYLFLEMDKEIKKEDLIKDFENILQQAEYLSTTIDDFKNFFTQSHDKQEPFHINKTMEKLYSLVKDSYNGNYITWHKDYDDIIIDNNENNLIQAIVNICNNAKDAIIHNSPNSSQRHFFVSLKKEDNFAVLKFKDNGGGISQDIIDKIFEPYFTTKHQSVGTGIGLYMTFQIITNNFHGTIEVNNVTYEYNEETYIGAEFTLRLPLNKERE